MEITVNNSSRINNHLTMKNPAFKAKLKFEKSAKKLLETEYSKFCSLQQNVVKKIPFQDFFKQLNRAFSILTAKIEGTFIIDGLENQKQIKIAKLMRKDGNFTFNQSEGLDPEGIFTDMYSFNSFISADRFIPLITDALLNSENTMPAGISSMLIKKLNTISGSILKTLHKNAFLNKSSFYN